MYKVYIVYVMYMVYNMYMYTISEFRDNLRQAFNDAEQGHEVVIERYGQKYQLVALVDAPLPHHRMESIPGESAKLKPSESLLAPIVTKPTGTNLCKIHGVPLTINAKCLMKGCKYA